MECDNCKELCTDEVYPVYRRDNNKKVFLCWRCHYNIFLREKDEARKEYLKSLMETLSSLKPNPKQSFWQRLISRKGEINNGN